LRHLFVDRTVLLECEAAIADPAIVRLIPDAPIPVAHGFTAPLIYAAMYDVSGSVRECPHRPWIIERRPELRECHHRFSADVQNGLHVIRELRPLLVMVRRPLVE